MWGLFESILSKEIIYLQVFLKQYQYFNAKRMIFGKGLLNKVECMVIKLVILKSL